MTQALEQFKIMNYQLFSYNMPNYIMSLFVLILFILFVTFMLNLKNMMFLTQSFVQMMFEELYMFVLNVMKQNMGNSGIMYFPMVFNVFYFIYFMNIGGLMGYNLQLTSHMFVTFTISMSLFMGVIIMGIYNLERKFLNQFIPKDAPKLLFPLLVVMETMSYVMSPFTLGMRLFANMFSGHVLLFVMISFVIVMMEKKMLMFKMFLIFPMMLLFFMMTLELLIMFLQAYVFIMLFCVYLNDSLHAH